VNRRRFLASVSAGAAAVLATTAAPRAFARRGRLTVRFVGMMGFVRRTDGSLLAVTPGHHAMQHFAHVPFAMARTGSRIALALDMQPAPGVVAEAFDDAVVGAGPDDFVFRCLEHSSLEVTAHDGGLAVDNRADQLAQMRVIAPGKRLRGDLGRWSHATVSLSGGRLVNSSAHPDAGKLWTIGTHQQPLTDAVNFQGGAASLRLTAGRDVRTFTPPDGEVAELWFVSSAGPRIDRGNPKRLEHGDLLSQFLVGADPMIAECETATGRDVPPTGLPCGVPAFASMGTAGARAFPPHMELCFQASFDDSGGGV
jgi:hypothetical protein